MSFWDKFSSRTEGEGRGSTSRYGLYVSLRLDEDIEALRARVAELEAQLHRAAPQAREDP